MALIIALPVFLLFVATAVPLYVAVGLLAIDVALVVALIRWGQNWLGLLAFFLGIILVSTLAIWSSQFYATTPPITDAQGEVVPGSIATLETVQLGDSEQWVSIRGKDVNKPVLLFLAGGPGGSQLTTARHELGELEDHSWSSTGSSPARANRSTRWIVRH